MRTLRHFLTPLFLTSVLVLAACSDDSGGGGNGDNDTGADAGSDQGGDQGTPDTGGDQGTPDQGTPDSGGACATPNTQCFTPLPSSNPNPRVMINAIDLADDWVEIKNVNTVDANLTGWWVCQRPNYQQLPDGITLGPAEIVRIYLNQSGTDTDNEIYMPLSSPLTADDEIALYSSNTFDSSDAIEVYLRWGSAASAGEGRASEADAAGLWSIGTFVPVCGDNTGIVGTGDGTLPIGFHDVPGTCPALQ